MAKLIPGINDLATLHPEIAAEADGWDPVSVSAGTNKKLPWRCTKGHQWQTTPNERTGTTNRKGTSCPYCKNRLVWTGFNDLKTKFPDVSEEAHGWDPSKVVYGSAKKMKWQCKKGHTWQATVVSRTGANKTGCPYCSNQKVWVGFNDLKTLFPEIAKEANGWDPSKMIAGSAQKKKWKCKKNHTWDASVVNRTRLGSGCPYCANYFVLSGFNDLKTLFPEIAKESDGWDPSIVNAGTYKKMPWKCKYGHQWDAVVVSRTGSNNTNCPVCSNQKVLSGFNDLQTRFPEIAKEANGWDPTQILPGTHEKLPWICIKGHSWKASAYSRTGGNETGCPECAETGFNPGKPSWFYLMQRPGEQQLGITNDLPKRMKRHGLQGWIEIDTTGPHDGEKIVSLELELKRWLKSEIGLIKGTAENWKTSNLEVHSLAELKEKSGIETSIF